MTDTITFARKYAQHGWQSFPCKPQDKTPLVKWADMATTEDNMLVGWWDLNPSANIAIACGKRSGIVVLDVDAAHGGHESLAELLVEYGSLPSTPVSKTGGGGEHIFFKHPGIEIRNSAGKLGRGLDIRGDGGYVIAPPSIHPNGTSYEWEVRPSQVALADMPQWMIELLKENYPPATKEKTDNSDIVSGERNNYLTKIAGGMRRMGLSEDSMFAALVIHNREKCNPPLSEGEVFQIASSISRYEPQAEPQVSKPLPNAMGVIEVLEAEIRERERDPKEVWGINYAWPFISKITGGKQKGELIILAGEPGVGKSWWAHQDALFTAVGNPSRKIQSVPTLIWSGEMQRKQVFRRFFEMLGVPKRAMLTGKMSGTDKVTGEMYDNWQLFDEAKAIVMNSPIYVSDASLDLKETRELLEREIGNHGIEQVVFDYDWLINAPGSNEIEQSQNISRAMKQIARDLNLSVILISSVNKTGMDSTNENVTKSNVSGSGKKLHDADVIYILTKFNESKNKDMNILPNEYPLISTLHITKGRELDYHLPNGAINYKRQSPNPKFNELRDPSDMPGWMK